MSLGRLHFVEPNGFMGLRVDPKKWVLPSICKLNLHLMIAHYAAWPPRLKYGFRAFASATNIFENQFPSFESRDSRGTTGLAEGSHILRRPSFQPLLRSER